MIEEVKNYLIDFDKLLGNDDGIIKEDEFRVKRKKFLSDMNAMSTMYKYTVDNIPAYLKYNNDVNFNYKHAYSIATSKMYNDLGLTNPQVFPIHRLLETSKTPIFRPATITQDVDSLKGIKCTLGAKSEFWGNLEVSKEDKLNKWSILYNKELRDYYLTYMTEECFEQFINYYLLGELRTDGDSHAYNYFFYKSTPFARKFDGFIPIDMDQGSEIMDIVENRQEFNNFLNNCYYGSYTPLYFITDTECTYTERIKKLINLIHSGKLSDKQITFLKRAINYDYPQAYLDACDKYHFDEGTSEEVDGLKYLWEYNQETLDKELYL